MGRELINHLTANDLRVLRLLGQGASVDEIAADLGMTKSTVSWYRTQIKNKLRCKSKAELMAAAKTTCNPIEE